MDTNDDPPTVYPRLGLTELRHGPAAPVEHVALTGTPFLLTDHGVPTGVMLAPVGMLRPDALPPAYFSAEGRARAAAAISEYGNDLDQGALAGAQAWARDLAEGEQGRGAA